MERQAALPNASETIISPIEQIDDNFETMRRSAAVADWPRTCIKLAENVAHVTCSCQPCEPVIILLILNQLVSNLATMIPML